MAEIDEGILGISQFKIRYQPLVVFRRINVNIPATKGNLFDYKARFSNELTRTCFSRKCTKLPKYFPSESTGNA